MKVLLFEWLTEGGLWMDSTSLDSAGNLLQQGVGMVSAVGLDLAKFAEVDLLVDCRLNQPNARDSAKLTAAKTTLGRLTRVANVHSIDNQTALEPKLKSLARDANAILLIAPETDDCLANSIRWLDDQSHKLISPALDCVLATSNKNQLADLLTSHGFDNIPPGMKLEHFQQLPDEKQTNWLPIVVKPVDGCGSERIEFFTTIQQFKTWLAQQTATQRVEFRVERFIAGTPTSIAVVCRHGKEPVFFPAMKQILRPPPVGEYQRSEDCLSESQQLRAKQLAAKAIACLPETIGFLGLDLVLNDQGDTAKDMLIEIPPGITMSYLKLSQKLDDGLIAKLMLDGLDPV